MLPAAPSTPQAKPQVRYPCAVFGTLQAWPPRLAAESFISHGVFAEPAQASAVQDPSAGVTSAGEQGRRASAARYAARRSGAAGRAAWPAAADPARPGLPGRPTPAAGPLSGAGAWRPDVAALASRRPWPGQVSESQCLEHRNCRTAQVPRSETPNSPIPHQARETRSATMTELPALTGAGTR
jgi:hypothetical protein